MTTADAKNDQKPGRFRLPDPPEREADEATQFDQLFKTGNAHYLIQHFGNRETTLVEADRWMVASPSTDLADARQPDLLIAFDVKPAVYEANNGYVVSEQGKPPDFVIEIASESTASIDVGEKRDHYAALGILEYWRFDKTGEFYGARLAGDRLVGGAYQPIPIDEMRDGNLRGYSAVLNLIVRWEQGQLGWYGPGTEHHIATLDSERARADGERQARVAAEARAENAEARIRELEQRLQPGNAEPPTAHNTQPSLTHGDAGRPDLRGGRFCNWVPHRLVSPAVQHGTQRGLGDHYAAGTSGSAMSVPK